jgi:hypothetical protein
LSHPRSRGDRAVGEVLGGVLMLSIAMFAFVMLAHAMLDQARQTAEYIRSLVPRDAPANATQPGQAQRCLAVGTGTWCAQPGGAPDPQAECARDSAGVLWCLVRDAPL